MARFNVVLKYLQQHVAPHFKLVHYRISRKCSPFWSITAGSAGCCLFSHSLAGDIWSDEIGVRGFRTIEGLCLETSVCSTKTSVKASRW